MDTGGLSRSFVKVLSRCVASEKGRVQIASHFVALRKKDEKYDSLIKDYAELLEDICNYRDLLVSHRIGEFQSSQKEKIQSTAKLVGLQVPKLYEEAKDSNRKKD